MQDSKTHNLIIIFLKLITTAICLIFIAEHYFLGIEPTAISWEFTLSFAALIGLNWYTKAYKQQSFFKPSHLPLVFVLLFLAVHFRAGIIWAQNTFPLKDANMVMLTLQEPFDDFAYMMVNKYLSSTVSHALAIACILTIFLYTVLGSTTKRLIAIGTYFVVTIIFIFLDVPVSSYIHILTDKPEDNASYSEFFAENYVNPDSVKIKVPEQRRNLILIYLESLETSFMDKEHGGNQDTNLIPEITNLMLNNLSFGKNGNYIGGGFDAFGSTSTFTTTHTRTLGIPNVTIYSKTPILRHYSSLYKILNKDGYHQIFFQGNPGLYSQFHDFVQDHKMDEIYGPDDLIQRMNLDTAEILRKQGYRTVQDQYAFKFANQILDTISEPFSLTFFTIDTHAPFGIYDPDCIKVPDENNQEGRLKATAICLSQKLDSFLASLKSKPFYDNTSIIVFGDHRFMGTSLINGSPQRKWVNFFINPTKAPILGEERAFSDVDMFPTILSAMGYEIEGNRLGFGSDLFSEKKTLVEDIGLEQYNTEAKKMSNHLYYESFKFQQKQK